MKSREDFKQPQRCCSWALWAPLARGIAFCPVGKSEPVKCYQLVLEAARKPATWLELWMDGEKHLGEIRALRVCFALVCQEGTLTREITVSAEPGPLTPLGAQWEQATRAKPSLEGHRAAAEGTTTTKKISSQWSVSNHMMEWRESQQIQPREESGPLKKQI